MPVIESMTIERIRMPAVSPSGKIRSASASVRGRRPGSSNPPPQLGVSTRDVSDESNQHRETATSSFPPCLMDAGPLYRFMTSGWHTLELPL